MGKKLKAQEIYALLDLLNDRFCEQYVEVPLVNITLKILGYSGYFSFNEKNNKVTYRIKGGDKR